MHPVALLLLCLLAPVVLVGRRVAAAAAVIASVCFTTMGQVVELGPFHFHFFRLVILVGLVRVATRGELRQLNVSRIDLALLAWLAVVVLSPLGHRDPATQLIFNLGEAFNTVFVYFLFRALIRNVADVVDVCKYFIGILLILAVAMVAEKATGHSMFEAFGGVLTEMRNGKIRAVGPFRHAILAGSVGAAAVPLLVGLRFRWPLLSLVGIAACLAITLSSASSGPLIALVFGMGGLLLWKYRKYRRSITWMGIAGLVLLQIIMKDDVWYLMARVDLVGGSTGWYRAYLIDMALAHFGEWWLAGTDYTRHWMPSGVRWSSEHSDMVNYYISLGVVGGLGLVVAYISTLTLAFKGIGRILNRYTEAREEERYLVWALGAVLFGHTVNSLSIAYFDQSVVLVFFVIACIGSLEAYPESLGCYGPGVLLDAQCGTDPGGGRTHRRGRWSRPSAERPQFGSQVAPGREKIG